MISARNVTLRRGRRVILEGVDLDVPLGQVTALIGPNGAGKSTLLAALAGDLAPASGQITIDDAPIGRWSPRALARRRAVMPQHTELAFDLPARDVVALGRLPFDPEPRDQRGAVVAEALAAVDGEALGRRPFSALSGGEQQRVALARALAQIGRAGPEAPRHLLLDEPTASLDLLHQHRLISTARRVARQGVGVLVILHDLQLAARCADQIALVGGGGVQSGAPSAVLTAPRLSALYGLPLRVIHHPESSVPLVTFTEPT